MSIDERLQFLLQSTESLHSNMQSLHSNMQSFQADIQSFHAEIQSFQAELRDLKGSVDRLYSVVEIDAENIRRLANIAAAHNDKFEDLGARLDRLERRT